ncbi:VPS10 domain-containing receptor SorCS1 [Aplysia californica]|uniref:VPS10 domain-containing receptor SorCS1 n=1 Tax=Aplysia californica TaxID=6500 RepID=A0ABM1ABR7_APLCA|nr:VPS10 domain-containing receptor SorCS1 [Aplysia californica]
MLSETSAPGVILAHGNLIGPGENGSLAVFSSRDGGWTWRQGPVSGGVHHFNILDQGGVLTVMLDGLMTGTKTNTMHYSCDEGLTWKKFPFIKDPLIVKGVLTEPGSLTVVESVFGNTKNKEPWTLIKLNFSSVLGSKCQEKDYEKWLPQDYNNNSSGKCILGRITEYSRRKVTNPPCYSGGVLKPKVKTNATCACTTEDYECDFGYEESGNECKKSSWFFDGYVAFECKKGMYSASQGYRKIPADSCIEGAEFKKRYDRVNKECPKVRPLGVSLTTETMNVRVGIETSFHMDQRGGSKTDTTYTWNFQDGSKPIQRSDFTSASVQSHTFPKVGRYNVSVSAENSKGSSNATLLIHVQEQIDNLLVLAPWAGKMGTPVNFQALASMGYKQAKSEHQHYVWTFGDEEDGDHPLLTWSSNVLHVFKVARTYQGTVEAVNSISSLHKHFKVRIFDAAVILLIDFSPEVSMYQAFPYVSTLFMHRVRQEISEALGVSLLRIECVFEDKSPHAGLLYIFPSSDQGDQTMQELSDRVKTMVKNKELKVSLFGKPYPGVELLSASDWTNSTDGPSPHGHGPNLKPVYIAAPILVLAVLVSTLTFFYCRRRQRAARHFTLLSSQDDSDALLDDDDEAPLDLNLDLGGRDTGRDDQLLDGGGSHLVMVTGGGTADNAETC